MNLAQEKSKHKPDLKRSRIVHVNTWSLWSKFFQSIKLRLQVPKWKNSRAKPGCPYMPTEVEKFANVFTHGMCVVPATIGALKLIERSQNAGQLMASSVYGGSLIMLFLVSTSFHCAYYSHQCAGVKKCLHRFDRSMIYIFMAGSYFPWLHIGDQDRLATYHFVEWMVWAFAIFGIIFQQLFHERFQRLETCFYLIMGLGPSMLMWIISTNEFEGMFELKIGGLLYVLGVYFFKSDGCIPMAHAIWHLFVVIAAGFHYYAILTYLFPEQIQIEYIFV